VCDVVISLQRRSHLVCSGRNAVWLLQNGNGTFQRRKCGGSALSVPSIADDECLFALCWCEETKCRLRGGGTGHQHALVAGVSPSQPLQVTPKITGKGAELTVFGSVVRQQGNLDGAGRGHRPHGKNVGHVVLPGRPLETRCHIVGVGHESLPPPGVPETVLLLKSSGN
jgi:hypothetical protein